MKHINKIPTIDFVLHEINGKEFKNQLYDAFKKFSCFQLTNLYGVFDSRHNFKVMEEILQNKEFLSRNMANQNNPRGFYFYQGKGVDAEQPYKEDIVAFQLGRIDKSELELRKPYLQLINSGPQFLTHGKIDWVDRCDFKSKMEKIYADHTYVAEILLQNLSIVLDIDLISMHSKKDYTLEYKKYQGVTKLEKTINALQQEYQNNNSTLGMTISDALDPSQELRLKPHKDLSTITLLSQTNIQEDYLQILYEGNWISVNEIPDASTMVVSCGDVLELLTAENHKLKSCIHRVISQRDSSTNRFSSVLFCTPNYESEIKKAGEIVYFGDLVPF